MHRRHNLFKQLFHDMSQLHHTRSTCMRERCTCVLGKHVTHTQVLPIARSKVSSLFRDSERAIRTRIIYHVVSHRATHVFTSCPGTCKSPSKARIQSFRVKGQRKISVEGTRDLCIVSGTFFSSRLVHDTLIRCPATLTRGATRRTGHVYTYTPFFVYLYFLLNVTPLSSLRPNLARIAVNRVMYVKISNMSGEPELPQMCWDRLYVRSFPSKLSFLFFFN